ncbi:MAG TPA: hypothetical protein VFV66_34765 [Nonomuraea sp.]|nr:hypothetical protein [Nonomuraea sp.]
MGDVLSPRWSNDDTDEQPAIQVVGNETYILPPEPQQPRDVLDVVPSNDSLHDHLSDPVHDALNDPLNDSRHDSRYDSLRDPLHDPHHDPLNDPLGGPLSGPHEVIGDYDDYGDPRDLPSDPEGPAEESPYLPLDRGYESGAYDDHEDDEPRRGFLGSGWTGDGPVEGDHEVRRRTRVLVVAAVAVVLIGVGAGFMLTGTSSDDPCAGGRCASAGEVTAPTESAAPEDTPVEEEGDTASEPTDPATDEPVGTESVRPSTQPQRVRPTREPSERPTRTRTAEPTARSSARPTRQSQQSPESEPRLGDESTARPDTRETERPDARPSSDAPTQAPVPSQAPTQDDNKGLIGILFPWL